MNQLDPVTEARLEGLAVELSHAATNFQDAAVSTLRNMENNIICNYPQFYSNEQRTRAGVPIDWKDRLYPRESFSWWRYNSSVCALLKVSGRAA